MSFYTYVERHYVEFDDEFDVDSLSNQIDEIVSKQVHHEDVASDLKQLLSNGEAEFGLESGSIVELVAEIAALAPGVSFACVDSTKTRARSG